MEKEIDLVHSMNRELGGIHEKVVSLDEKISENHELHLQNANKIDEILVQTTKTNGRVTNCESFIAEQHKINSKLNGLLTERWNEREKFKQGIWTKVIYAIIGIIALGISQFIFPNLELNNLIKLFT